MFHPDHTSQTAVPVSGGSLPPIDNDFDQYDGDDGFSFDPSMARRIHLWAAPYSAGGLNGAVDLQVDVATFALAETPVIQYSIRSVSTPASPDGLITGSITQSYAWNFSESNINFSSLEAEIVSAVRHSTLKEYLHLSELAFSRALQNDEFRHVLLGAIFSNKAPVLKEAGVAVHDQKDDCREVEASVNSFLKRRFPDSPVEQVKIYNTGSITAGAAYRYLGHKDGTGNSGHTLTLNGTTTYSFSGPANDFQQTGSSESAFLRAPVNVQKELLQNLADFIEYEIAEDLNAYVDCELKSYGRYRPATYYDPPEYPDYEVLIDPQSIKVVIDEKSEILTESSGAGLLPSIPEKLLRQFAIPARGTAGSLYERASFNATLTPGKITRLENGNIEINLHCEVTDIEF